MGKRGRAEDKGKGEDDDVIGILKVVAISTSTWLACLKTAFWAVACAPLGAHPWSPRAPLMVRAGGVRTRGMGKRGRAEDKGKGEGDDLIGIFKSSCHIRINAVCLIEDRLLGSCLWCNVFQLYEIAWRKPPAPGARYSNPKRTCSKKCAFIVSGIILVPFASKYHQFEVSRKALLRY
jgi:hypothetical protein